MIGAIIGDIVGSRFEWKNKKTKEFELFDEKCKPTDDSIMSLAIAKAILDCGEDYGELSTKAIYTMRSLGRAYDNAGYGKMFKKWLNDANPQPYNSYGNGSAMRVGPCGFAADSIEQVKELSAAVTEVTHNSPEGMKGAEAVAVAVFMARNEKSIKEIKEYIVDNYYEIDFTLDQIRKDYKFNSSCQGSVPIALEAFFEAIDFEDAIRNAISVGGDSDTIAAMTGVIAEAYYGVPDRIIEAAIQYLDASQMEIVYEFEKKYTSMALNEYGQNEESVIEVIEEYIDRNTPEEAKTGTEGKPDFSIFNGNKADKKTRAKLDDQLKTAVTEYNYVYTDFNDKGMRLFNQRERAVDVLDFVETLINSIANHPKQFDTDIAEISVNKIEFRNVCDFARKEFESARESAMNVGAGVAAGVAFASLAPSAAMWVATTFGTASTGTAISALSGAAAHSAALAWLGGGAVVAGGEGMAGGSALLALAGPIGWTIAGATLLASIALFTGKKIKIDKEKKDEIESVKRNTEQLKEASEKMEALLKKTEEIRNGLREQYTLAMPCFGKDFTELSDESQTLLGALVNNAKALAVSLGEGV